MILKRTLSALLALLTVCALVSCGKKGEKTTDSPEGEQSVTPSATSPSDFQTDDPSSDFSGSPSIYPSTTPSVLPSITPSSSLSSDLSKEDDDVLLFLSEEDMTLYKNSYEILYNRITDRGYAITSLTGTYFGMFTRDSAIQSMAHLAYGDSDAAREILRYLLSYHAALGLHRGTHIIDEIKDEEYRNNYLSGKGETAVNYYEEQTEPGIAQFLINAPNNGAATPFVTKKRSVSSVKAYLEGAKSAVVKAEIYRDLKDQSTLVGQGSLVLEESSAGFKTIPLESTVTLVPGETYYLKLYATEGSGRVVLYGITAGQTGYLKAWNHDKNAYGGDGWRQVDVYVAFVIGESDTEVTDNYRIAQHKADTGLYIINAPNNGAAIPFVPKNDRIYSVNLHLDGSGENDKVEVGVFTDYKDPKSALGKATYVFGSHPDGWQNIAFEEPISVVPGQTYYLVLQATAESGKVILNGSTTVGGPSYNYDVAAFGGWEQKPYAPAFEIFSFKNEQIAKGFEARGNTIKSVELSFFSSVPEGSVQVEVRSDYTDAATTLAAATAKIDKVGAHTYTLCFDNEVSLRYKNYYYLVVTIKDSEGTVRLLTDPTTAADSYAFDESWVRVGYEFLVSPAFEVDKATIITLDGKTAGLQEIPTAGELITAVKVLLAKEKGAAGRVKATLYKGNGSDAQQIGVRYYDVESLSENADWVLFKFDLPLVKTKETGNYYLKLETEDAKGKVFWCGSSSIDNYKTFTMENGIQKGVLGEASFEALKSELRLISDYTQTDANYMLIHAFVMYVNNNKGTPEDLLFIKEAYPIIKDFANYYIDDARYYNKKMDLLLNPSLEHSRKIRYWVSYDLLTNVFASQALYELSAVAGQMEDGEMQEKWMSYAKKIEEGINTHLVTEVDGKKIYGEFYDVEDDMRFYQGISWVNFAPVAAEWYGMDIEIMKNTYEVYKKYASVKMYGQDCLATEATLGTNELTRELIGKGIAWELMFCKMIGDDDRIKEIVELELKTAEKNKITVYPEFWKSESYVTDPGNQEHCSWQVYAMSIVFPELVGASAK